MTERVGVAVGAVEVSVAAGVVLAPVDGVVLGFALLPLEPPLLEPPPLGGLVGTTADDAVEALDVPPEFVAVTVNVYDVPAVRPVTVHDVPGSATVHVRPPGLDVAVYDAGLPVAAVQETSADCCPAVARTPVGAAGGARIVTDDDGVDAAVVPPVFVAVTANVYEVPFVRPVTSHVVAGAVAVHVRLPGVDVTV